MKTTMSRFICLVLAMMMALSMTTVFAEEVKWTEEQTPYGWIRITQEGGPTLGYSPDSGVKILTVDGYAFKDLNKNGELDVYEDWRLDDDTRAADLAARISVEQGSAMMLLQFDSNGTSGNFIDVLKEKLNDGVRVLTNNDSTDVTVTTTYLNTVQAYVEALDFGIPVTTHSETGISIASVWPNNLGMAATFDPELGKTRAMWYAKEFRALGITDPNLPQIDTSSDPRYTRYPETFGEDPQLILDMALAYVDGLQSTYDAEGNDLGWGAESVVAVIKHFPGNGTGEGGRGRGSAAEYDIYPGDNFYSHVAIFEAAMHTTGKTGGAASVMPKYNVDIDESGDAMGEEKGASYNSYIAKELLREELGFDGVVVTDYGITVTGMSTFGMEDKTEAERHYKLLENEIDLIALSGTRDGVWDAGDIMLEAVAMYKEAYGEEATQERIERSVFRIVRNKMRLGMFENPYLDTAYSLSVVNCDEAQDDAYSACLKSVVMLKNATNLIQERKSKPTVYMPLEYVPAVAANESMGTPAVAASFALPSDIRTISKYFKVVTDTVGTPTGPADEDGNPTLLATDVIPPSAEEMAKVDFALVMIANPQSDGVDENGEIIPKTLQYRKYTADSIYVRKTSLSGEFTTVTREDTYGAQTLLVRENRSYFGRSATATNEADLDKVLRVAELCENVVVAVKTDNPFIPAELDEVADSILLYFGNNMYHTDIGTDTNLEKALYDIVAGNHEPSGLLPFQMPIDMDTVELQMEDISRDCDPYVDSQGNVYDFTFGMNWEGVINDERVEKYNVDVLEF